MNQMKIRLNATEDVLEFVKVAERCDFDVDVCLDSAVVDAKSILGVLSLGLAKSLTVQYHGENTNFTNAISKFAIA